MSKRPRRNHTPAFKAKVALAAIKGDRSLVQLAEQFDVHPNQITSWKAQLEGGAADVFGPDGGHRAAQPAVDVKSSMPRLVTDDDSAVGLRQQNAAKCALFRRPLFCTALRRVLLRWCRAPRRCRVVAGVHGQVSSSL